MAVKIGGRKKEKTMTFNFTFNENEINLIWNIFNTCNISGKDAPILTNIFQKMQDALRQQAQMQAKNNTEPAPEEKTEE